MKARPWPIVTLGVIHILHPLLTFIFMGIALGDGFSQIFNQSSGAWDNIRFWFLFPLAGLAIIAMRPWSYVVLFAVWAESFVYNFKAWQAHPELLSIEILILNYLVSLFIIIYFLVPNVRAVYFNPRVRWWEQKPRFLFDIPCSVQADDKTYAGMILDLSVGGAFCALQKQYPLGTELMVKFEINQEPMRLKGKIVHERPEGEMFGYGVQFLDFDKKVQEKLQAFVKGLASQGVGTRPNPSELQKSFFQWAKTLVTSGKGLLPQVPNGMDDKRYQKPKNNQE